MKEIGTCQDCRYWENKTGFFDDATTVGICSNKHFKESNKFNFDNNPECMVIASYGCRFVMDKNFGCIH